jgi:NAD+ kinase
MLKVLVAGRNKKSVSFVNKKILKYKDLKLSKNPEVIISVGGDGTYFYNERKYPGIPKILVRDSSICKLCSIYELNNIDFILKKLNERKFSFKECMKLECTFKNKKLIGINDIVIRNKDQSEAIRFNVKVNNKNLNSRFIGDGIVVSTPFGSTGYFSSITKTTFTKGIGLAFNNVLAKSYEILKDNDSVDFSLLKGKALVSADNNKKLISLKENNKIRIKKSKEKAFIILLW